MRKTQALNVSKIPSTRLIEGNQKLEEKICLADWKKPRPVDLFGLALGLQASFGQVVLMREALAVSGGNELTIGLGLACWLLGVGVGALAAGQLPRPGIGLLVIAFSSFPLIAGGALLLRLHRLVIDLPAGHDPTLTNLAALLAVTLGVGGFTVGFLFTTCARTVADGTSAPVSRLYWTEAIGSLLGGLVFTFAIAGRVGHLVTVAVGASVLVAACALDLKRSAGRVAVLISATALATLALAGPLDSLDRWSAEASFARLSAGKLVGISDSAYGRLALGHSEDQYQLFADGRLVQTFPDPWSGSTRIHLALVQHPDPQRILLVGGGPSERVAAALAHNPKKVVLTFLDAREMELCRPFWSASTRRALADPRVQVIQDDGRRYVTTAKERFDVVLVAARPPLSSQANRYHTAEFYAKVKRILRPGGSLTIIAPGGANLLAPEAARAASTARATLGSVFGQVVVVPGLELLLHAADQPGVVSGSAELLGARFAARNVKSSHFSPRRFAEMLVPKRVESVAAQLDQLPQAINFDLKPQSYLANLQLWERSLSQGADAPTLTGFAERWAWLWLVIPLALWAVWRGWSGLVSKSHRNDAVFSIATTGAAGMAVEVMVLYVYQAASGRLYVGLAFLVALFMTGLAAGAVIGRRWLGPGSRFGGPIADIVALLTLLATGPMLTFAVDLPQVVAAWSIVAGVMTGAAFTALLTRAAAERDGDERSAAAAIESADHLGAAFGALVTGVIWVPVFGISATCLLFASLKLASLAGLLLPRRGRIAPGTVVQ